MSTKKHASRDLDQTIAEVGFEWKSMTQLLEDAKSKPFDEELAHKVFSAL